MAISILVIGGYGGVGKHVVKRLLKHFSFKVIIGGRNTQKGESLKNELLLQYPNAQLEVAQVDAANKKSLLSVFNQVDLAIVTATVPDHIQLIAEAAIECDIDLMDILIRGDVVSTLAKFEDNLKGKNRMFITQCGFHPGIIAPMIRLASSYFNRYNGARVMMAMEGVFESPEAIKEILYEIIEPNAQILDQAVWRKASYKDAITFEFAEPFGKKECYPAQMKEIDGIDMELGLQNCAVYAAGFDSYIDRFLFPLAVVLGFFSKKLSQNVCSGLFYRRIKHKKTTHSRTHLVVNANGVKNNENKKVRIDLNTHNSFDLTAVAIMALLNQYLDKTISEPGLYLMGKVVEEKRLFDDMAQMGTKLEIS
nr:saccharopine dehydrogenase NADP-binding domain-containing protein [Allomuricauda sp.]